MARFKMIVDPPESSPLSGIYREIVTAGFGEDQPINWFTSQGIRPDVLAGAWCLVKSVLAEGELPGALKQMIATVISKQNNCRYCKATHTGVMNMMGVPQDQIDSCASDPELKAIPEPQRSVALFAAKAAAAPNDVTDEDFARLRGFNLSDGEILEVCMMAAFTNFINTWADLAQIPIDGE